MSDLRTDVIYSFNDGITARLEAVEKKLAHFDAMLAKTDRHVSTFGQKMKMPAAVNKLTSTLEAIPNLNTGILSSAGSMANPYVAAGAAVAALGAFTVDAGRDALAFNEGMAKINVTARLGQTELDAMGKKLMQLPRYGKGLLEIPESFNKILSATGDVNKSMDVMGGALKLSTAAKGNLDVTAKAMVNVMGSAGNEFTNVAQISDMLSKTLKVGAAEFDDLANYLPKVIPYAKQLGWTAKESAGAFATMTSMGQSSEQSAMLLQNIFTAFGDPKKRANIEQFVDVFDNTGKIKSFSAVFGELQTKMAGMSDEQLAKFKGMLDLDAQAGSALQQLVQNSDLLGKNIDAINNSAGDTDAALAAGSTVAQQNIAKLTEKYENLKMKLGQAVAPFWDKITSGLVWIWEALEKAEEKTGIFSLAWDLLKAQFVLISKVTSDVFHHLQRLGNFMSPHLSMAFEGVGEIVKIVVGGLRDLVFVAIEAVSALTNLFTFNFSGLRGNIESLFNHDYHINGTDAAAGGRDQEISDREAAMAREEAALEDGGGTLSAGSTVTNTVDAMLAPKGKKGKKPKQAKSAANADELHGLASGGGAVRHVTTHISKLVEKLEIHVTNLGSMTTAQIRKHIEEALVLAVRDSELALAH
ncbi:MAG: hypothetical protein RL660_452 [Bacteroidota bacterium]|jgi:TP901 family phage tail tape measure protein